MKKKSKRQMVREQIREAILDKIAAETRLIRVIEPRKQKVDEQIEQKK